jgi:hypothetical protein
MDKRCGIREIKGEELQGSGNLPAIIQHNYFLEKYDELGRKINKYIQYVEKEWK